MTHYYNAKPIVDKDTDVDSWCFRIYHYDPAGNKEILDHRSGYIYTSKGEAEDAATDWCEDNNIEAELD